MYCPILQVRTRTISCSKLNRPFRFCKRRCHGPPSFPPTSMNHGQTIPLPSHLTSRIAAELHDSIIDHLHSCKPALYSCSTVCKAWLPTCRYHLFSKVNLRPAFVEFLRSSPHTATAISPYISQVTLGGGWMREQQAEFNDVISFLLTLERVDELYLGTWSWDYVSTETTMSLLDARASLFQNLTKLAMTHIRFPSFDFLIRFISGFPVLKELSLHNIMWEAPKCPLSPLPSPSTTNVQASPLLPSRLQTLNIFSSSNSPILYWVLTGGRLHAATDHEQVVPALRKLVLSDILPTESHLVGSLLRTVGPSLQHLELGFLTHNASPHAIQGLHILTHTSSMTHMYMY